MSKYVVLADFKPKDAARGTPKLSTYTVNKVYKGSLAVGQVFQVDEGLYDLPRRNVPMSSREGEDRGFTVDNETYLFLDDGDREETQNREDIPMLRIVPSGMRVISLNRVFRFEQYSSPGGLYLPTVQGRDPYDLSRGVLPGLRVDCATFERDLNTAMRRAAKFEKLLGEISNKQGSTAFLSFLGPPRPFSLFLVGKRRKFTDAIAQKAYKKFMENQDLGGALDVMNRFPESFEYDFGQFSPAELTSIALDDSQARQRRVTALRLLGNVIDSSSKGEQLASLLVLLEKDDFAVRQAAALFFGKWVQQYRQSPQYTTYYVKPKAVSLLNTLGQCWKRERDARVDAVILWGMRGFDKIRDYLQGPKEVPAGYIMVNFDALVPGRLYYARALYGVLSQGHLKNPTVTIKVIDKKGKTVRTQLYDQRVSISENVRREESRERRREILEAMEKRPVNRSGGSNWVKSFGWQFYFSDPLPDGDYEFIVEMQLEKELQLVPSQAVTVLSGRTPISVDSSP